MGDCEDFAEDMIAKYAVPSLGLGAFRVRAREADVALQKARAGDTAGLGSVMAQFVWLMMEVLAPWTTPQQSELMFFQFGSVVKGIDERELGDYLATIDED